MTKNTLFLLVCIISQLQLIAQNQIPLLNKTSVQTTGTNSYKIVFELFDTDNDVVEIRLSAIVSEGRNKFKTITIKNASGDIGYPVKTNGIKEINFELDPTNTEKDILFHLVADDKEKLNAQEILNQVSSKNLENNLNYIQGKRNTSDPVQYGKCRDFIVSSMTSSNMQNKTLKAISSQYVCLNYEANKFGGKNPQAIFINDAHYDSFNQAPGADDNGSGVVGVLEAMKILAPYESNKSLRFLFFDLEENGLVGSILYLTNQVNSNDSIKAVLNYEMIGYYSEENNSQQFPNGFNLLFPDAYAKVSANNNRGDFITNVANTNSTKLKAIFDNNALGFVPQLKVISFEVPANGTIAPDLRRSDHAPFWDKNIPALMITDGANFRNKNYHTLKDSIHYLNFDFMSNIVKNTIACLIELAEVQHAAAIDLPYTIINKTKNEIDKSLQIYVLENKIILDFNSLCDNFSYRLVDQQGKIINEASIQNNNKKNHSINTGSSKEGIYFLNICCNKTSFTKKIFIR